MSACAEPPAEIADIRHPRPVPARGGLLWRINDHLVRCAMRKYIRLRRREKRARLFLAAVARRFPGLFAHWRFGLNLLAGDGSRVSREASARFRERRGVRFPPPTLPVVHCVSEAQARNVLAAIAARMEHVGFADASRQDTDRVCATRAEREVGM